LIFGTTCFNQHRIYNTSSIVHNAYKKKSRPRDLGLDFLSEHTLQGVSVFSELLDTLMKLVECHLVLKKRPAEFWLIVDIGDFGNWISLRSGLCVELLGNRLGAVLEILKERRCDSEEINSRK